MAMDKSKVALEELQQLAGFWSDKGDALSVYFQWLTPSELAHREEPILAKQKIQEALGSLHGNNRADREDIRRVMETISAMKGNGGRAKVMFACGRQNIWHEYDVPGNFGVRIEAGSSFVLAPLLGQQQSRRRYCIALADRNRARGRGLRRRHHNGWPRRLHSGQRCDYRSLGQTHPRQRSRGRAGRQEAGRGYHRRSSQPRRRRPGNRLGYSRLERVPRRNGESDGETRHYPRRRTGVNHRTTGFGWI